MGNNSFTQDKISKILKVSRTDNQRIISRESSTLEFKESFGWKSLGKYLKTCAAFANTKGGYIVFGVANSPHTICGLSGDNLKTFESIDPEKISEHFNFHFSPEIEWDHMQIEMQGKTIGLISIQESKNKPVICTKNDGDLKESDIYYRYSGRSERVKYSELRSMLEEKREKEQLLWMQHIRNIARIGVRDTGIFNINTGSVTGSGGSFLIEESLLSQLSFIKEGEFSETRGKPTLKLIGKVEPLIDLFYSGNKQKIATKGIRMSDIVLDALYEKNVDSPLDYITQICFEGSAFLPLYYYINKSNKTKEEIAESVLETICRSKTRNKLHERITSGKSMYLPISNNPSESNTQKRLYIARLLNMEPLDIPTGTEFEYFLQSIRALKKDDIEKMSQYIRALLRDCFNRHYSQLNCKMADILRRTICWIDEALYK